VTSPTRTPCLDPGQFSQTNVAVVGAGYVGLPTAATLASFGHNVVCADSDQNKIRLLNSGISPIAEPGLEELMAPSIAAGNLSFVSNAARAVERASVIFLCLPTPQSGDGSADLSAVEAVSREVAHLIPKNATVVMKSTVPIGTSTRIAHLLRRPDISVVSNPEFLREGFAVSESLSPERIVVGSSRPGAAQEVANLFAPSAAPVIVTDSSTAEAMKYAANAFLATKLSFINAIAGLCEVVGADVEDIVTGLGLDSRIGGKFLSPGPGWGGSCLPKDTAALAAIARINNYEFPLLDQVIATNETQLNHVVDKVAAVNRGLFGANIAVWGLTFKAGTDDRRDSPSLDIAKRLLSKGAAITAFDPSITQSSLQDPDLASFDVTLDPYEAARDADVLVILTEWEDFADPDLAKLMSIMAHPRIVDARNILDPFSARAAGFIYDSIGRR